MIDYQTIHFAVQQQLYSRAAAAAVVVPGAGCSTGLLPTEHTQLCGPSVFFRCFGVSAAAAAAVSRSSSGPFFRPGLPNVQSWQKNNKMAGHVRESSHIIGGANKTRRDGRTRSEDAKKDALFCSCCLFVDVVVVAAVCYCVRSMKEKKAAT